MVRAQKTLFRSLRVWPWGFVPTAFVLSGCGAEPAVLTVGEVSYTATQLVGVPPSAVETLVATTALTIAASKDEIVERAVMLRERAEFDALADAARREVILEAADVGDDQLQARYETAPAYELYVRHLVVLAERALPDAQRRSARDLAQHALSRIRAGEDFAQVAGEVSDEPGAARRGGLLQPGREGSWVDEFWSAAQALAPGEVSPVVESIFGFHVLKLDDRRPIAFEEMRDRVAMDVAALLPSEPASVLADALHAEIDVESAAVSDWEAGAGTRVLARWPTGQLDAARFRRLAMSGTAGEFRAATGSPQSREAAVARAALTVALSDVARDRGLAADSERVAQVLDDFRLEALGWAAALELVGPPTPDGLAERALGGLVATGQNATIARRDLENRAPLLSGLYPVSGPSSPGTTETTGELEP